MAMYVHPGASGLVDYYLTKNDSTKSKKSTFLQLEDYCTCPFEEFIILAEFSEITGPIPLITIPFNAQKCKNLLFDINDFIIKNMSLDYQSSASDDVQVLRMDFLPRLHTYLHYTTLHDLKARGFVRPICFAYICSDKHKIKKLFPFLREQFLKITDIIKSNNRQLFLEEIQKSLQKMKEKQNKYFSIQKKEEDELTPDDNLFLQDHNISLLVNQYNEHTKLLHFVEPKINEDILTIALINKWEKYFASKSENPLVETYNASLQNHIFTLEETNYLKNILFLSPWGFSLAFWKLLNILRFFKRDYMEINLEDVSAEISSQENALHDAEYIILLENFIKMLDKNNLNNEDHFSFSYIQVEQTFNRQVNEDETQPSKDNNESTEKNKLVQFFRNYSNIIPHIFYSLFIGRCLIFVGNESYENIINDIILLMKDFHPSKEVKTLSWLKGILLNPHISTYKIIGLCVPERITFHDMISLKDKNYVTILDMKKKEFFGPAYMGKFLLNLNQITNLDMNDESLTLFIHSTLFVLKEKAFLYNSIMVSPESLGEIPDQLYMRKKMNLNNCDFRIIKYIKDYNKL